VIYEAETDKLRKRYMAGEMLADVISSLLDLPKFKSDPVHYGLKDLVNFLSDLEKGRAGPWAAPVNVGGTNIATTAQWELKIWVRAAYGVLKGSGFKPVEAYRRIASGLTKNGKTRRKDKPVRWKMVQRWCREGETQKEPHLREIIESKSVEIVSLIANYNVVDDWGKPVPEKEIAGRVVDDMWSGHNLRD